MTNALFLVPAILLLSACAASTSAVQQAERQCGAQGRSAGSAAFASCVEQVTDRIYRSWGRDAVSKGD